MEGHETAPARNPWASFWVVACGVFVVYLDVMIVNVAFPSMLQSFDGVTLAQLSWVLNAYAIGFAALLVPAGRLADRIGRKRGFLIGMGLFTLASIACGAAPSVGLLIAARVVQSAGAAIMIPSSLALLLASFPPHQRVSAIGSWAAIAAFAAALGPSVGGVLVESTWRWVFFLNVPIGIAAIVAGRRILHESKDPAGGRIPDLIGIALLGISVALLVLGIVQGPDWGWTSARVLGAFALACALGAGFLVRCVTHDVPAIELDLLRSKRFAGANVASLVFTGAMSGMIIASILFVQDVWHYSPIQAGLGVAPGAVLAGLGSVVIGRIGVRLPAREVCVGGSVLFALGLGWWLWRLTPDPHYLRDMLPGSVLTGFGIGLVQPVMTAVAATSVPPARFATGGAVLNVARQIGTALGIALVVAVLGNTPTFDHFATGWVTLIGASLLAAVASLWISVPKSGMSS
jgi:EmrB/QacA subfamily drug resistance transporter